MPWTPIQKALNLRAIADNILTYWLANQADAVPWAATQLAYADPIPLLKRFSDSAAILAEKAPVFPAVAFASDADAADYNDAIESGYIVRFDTMVTGPNAEVCVRQARVYSLALLSMLLNCPKATLAANARVTINNTHIEDTIIEFGEILSNEEQTDFMQRFELQATIRVHASSFEGA
jgi:hypothetical protein